MTAETPAQADEPVTRIVQVPLCDPCIDGQGQECHTPGCAFFLFAPPERSIRDFTTIAAAPAQPAPELDVAMRETRELREQVGQLAYELKVSAAKLHPSAQSAVQEAVAARLDAILGRR